MHEPQVQSMGQEGSEKLSNQSKAYRESATSGDVLIWIYINISPEVHSILTLFKGENYIFFLIYKGV